MLSYDIHLHYTIGTALDTSLTAGAVVDGVRKGTNGVSINGVTANFVFSFDRGTFWVLPLTYFCLPQSARAYLFP